MDFGADAFGGGAFGGDAFGDGSSSRKKKKDKKEKKAKFADEALDYAAPAASDQGYGMGYGATDGGFGAGTGFGDTGTSAFGMSGRQTNDWGAAPQAAQEPDSFRASARLVEKLASESGQRGESAPYYMARLHEIIDTSPEERAANDAEARRAMGEAHHPGAYVPTSAHGLRQAELLGLVGVHSKPPTGELPTAHELLLLQRAYAELAYRGEPVPSWLYMRPNAMATHVEPFLKTVPANFRGFDEMPAEYHAGSQLASHLTPSSPILDRWPLSEQLYASLRSVGSGQPAKEDPNSRYVWQRVVELAEAYVRRTPEPMVGAGAKKSQQLSVPHFTRPDEDPRYGIAPKLSHHEKLDEWVRSKIQADDKIGARLERGDEALEKEWARGVPKPKPRKSIPVDSGGGSGLRVTTSGSTSTAARPSSPPSPTRRAILPPNQGSSQTGYPSMGQAHRVPVVRTEIVSAAPPRPPSPTAATSCKSLQTVTTLVSPPSRSPAPAYRGGSVPDESRVATIVKNNAQTQAARAPTRQSKEPVPTTASVLPLAQAWALDGRVAPKPSAPSPSAGAKTMQHASSMDFSQSNWGGGSGKSAIPTEPSEGPRFKMISGPEQKTQAASVPRSPQPPLAY